MAKDRRMLTAPLSVEAMDGWRSFARREGVTMSAAAEAIGLILGDPAGLPAQLRHEVIRLARDVAAERRARASES